MANTNKHYTQLLKEELEKQEVIDTAPKTLNKKAENFWYHYKMHTIAGIFVLIIASVTIYDFVTRINPDISIPFSTTAMVGVDAQMNFDLMFSELVEDYNGDGNKVVQILAMQMPTEESGDYSMEMLTATQARLAGEFSSHNNLLMVLDDYVLEYLTQGEDLEYFVDFSAIYPELALEDRYRLPFSKTSIDFSDAVFGRFDAENTFIIMRNLEGLKGSKLEKAQVTYKNQLEFLDRVVNGYEK